MSDEANAYIERQRALARERQQRSRDRRRNGRDGHVTPRTYTKVAKPPLHEEPGWWNGAKTNELTVARNLAVGMSGERALIEAGQSRNAAILLEKGKQRLADVLKEKALTLERVVENTVKRIDAKSPMFTADGCIERDDWQAQASGCRDGIALLDRAGELPSASNTQHGPQITINIVRYSSGPQDVVDAAHVIETQATKHSQVVEYKED
jgi:hypothetical protein